VKIVAILSGFRDEDRKMLTFNDSLISVEQMNTGIVKQKE
jgi:hypothetical protein